MGTYFYREASSYKRDVNPIENYIKQAVIYLHKQTNQPVVYCLEFITKYLSSKSHPGMVDPIVSYLERGENGDREEKRISLSNYIKETIDNNDILIPSFTTYIHPTKKKSLLSGFALNNTVIRSRSKKEAFKAKADGNIELYISKNNEQGTMKIYNNSLSGGFGSSGTSLFNPTAHSTLTSTIRTVTSIGNTINEKIVSGNRHYWSYDVVLSNITSILSLVDVSAFEEMVYKYNLYIPNTVDVIECIRYSSDLYWKNNRDIERLKVFVDKLSGIEKAIFIYVGDLYHTRKHNSDFIRTFLMRLTSKKAICIDNPTEYITKVDEGIYNLACHICSTELKGYGKRFEDMRKDGILDTLVGVCVNITEVLDEYSTFISQIFASNTIPSSSGHIKSMIRRSVVLSDTDSTIFSTDEYVSWYFGEFLYSPESFSIAAAVMFLATQSISNGLRILSRNINVAEENISILNMKPEFSFPVFANTSVSKHYFAIKVIQEGNVFSEPENEVKGVHLINSAMPKDIRTIIDEKIDSVMMDVYGNRKISLKEYLTELANLERKIESEVLAGSSKYFKAGKIKSPDSYAAKENQSPYAYHKLWVEVFEPKYGNVIPIPYNVLKIPLTLENKTKVIEWLATIEDREFGNRMGKWLLNNKKDTLPTIFINDEYIHSNGVPKELVSIVNSKKIILELTKALRYISETLGFYIKTDMLVSELGY